MIECDPVSLTTMLVEDIDVAWMMHLVDLHEDGVLKVPPACRRAALTLGHLLLIEDLNLSANCPAIGVVILGRCGSNS